MRAGLKSKDGRKHLAVGLMRRRMWVRAGLVCCIVLALATEVALHAAMPAHASRADTREYGASDSAVQNAVNASQWPQQQSNWCGIATVAAVARFLGNPVSQQDTANYLNSSASVSEWGPLPKLSSAQPPFIADIAYDGGTDPRSLAAGLQQETGQHTHQFVDFQGAWDATLHLVSDVARTNEPISVIVDHGQHSVLVSAVYATDDPSSNPGSVTSLVVWDPGFSIPGGAIQSAQMVVVPVNTWLTDVHYWGSSYSPNYFGSIPFDPDPSIGPYTYDPSHNLNAHLWIGQYVYLRPDAQGDVSNGINVDWPFNQNDALIVGVNGQKPQGYTGPIFPLLNKWVLNETSIDAPALWTETANTANASGGFTPVMALGWTGTDGQHHLNVSLSADGVTFVNKKTLPETSIMRPAVLVVPVSGGGNAVAMAWVGTDAGHTLNVVYDVYGSYTKMTFWGETTPYPPALAAFGGQLWLSWTGTDDTHALNIMALGPLGQQHGAKTTLWTDHGGAGPTLVTDARDNEMLVTWMNGDQSHPWFNLIQSSDGINWSSPLLSSPSQTTINTPSFIALGSNVPNTSGMDGYYWAWTNMNAGGKFSFMQSSSLTNWPSSPIPLTDSTPWCPVLGYVGQAHHIVVGWTGTDGAHHLNIAAIAV